MDAQVDPSKTLSGLYLICPVWGDLRINPHQIILKHIAKPAFNRQVEPVFLSDNKGLQAKGPRIACTILGKYFSGP
jgi:hypothetical protein